MQAFSDLNMQAFSDLNSGEKKSVSLVQNKALLPSTRQIPIYRLPIESNAYYFTHNMWLDNDTLIFEAPQNIEATNYAEQHTHSIILKGQITGEKMDVTRLSPQGHTPQYLIGVLSPNKQDFYYIHTNKIIHLNLHTLKYNILLDLNTFPLNCYCSGMATTADKTSLLFSVNLQDTQKGKVSSGIYQLNLRSLELKCLFLVYYPVIVNHVLCSPVDSHLISFACTKYTDYPQSRESKQRLWLMDLKTHKRWNLYNQRKTHFFGFLSRYEVITHESWGYNGKYLTFIARRHKIKRVFVKTQKSETIMEAGPNPWHCDGSKPNHFVFDTMNKNSGIWLGKYNSTKLKQISLSNPECRHQGEHPHPFLSPNEDRVVFNNRVGKKSFLHFTDVQI